MKRILVLAFCFLIVGSCAIWASADNGGIYENAGELYGLHLVAENIEDDTTNKTLFGLFRLKANKE